MITAEAIAAAKARTRYWGYTATEFAVKRSAERCAPPVHEHDDCIRIAYEWLDAQKKTKNPRWPRHYTLKHLIERWAGRYVSQNDVEVAAELHPEIRGVYPRRALGVALGGPSGWHRRSHEAAELPRKVERHGAETNLRKPAGAGPACRRSPSLTCWRPSAVITVVGVA